MALEMKKMPRGPRGRMWPTLQVVRDPHVAFGRWAKQYGDPFYVHAMNGPIVVTGRPDLIKQIYGSDPDLFEPFATKTLVPMFGAGSMLLMSGEPHRRERKLMTPMFHGDRMKAYADAIHTVALDEIAQQPLATEFATLPLTVRVSFQVIVRTIFGGNDPQVIDRMLHAGRQLVKSLHPLLFFSRKTHFSFAGISPWDRFRAAIARLDAALDYEIDQRQGNPSAVGEDILSMLVSARYEDGTSMSREHIRDELRTFLFAGHETSAIAMAWAVYHVHRNPHVLATLRKELDAAPRDQPAALAQLPYLKAVVQETLRIHPIVTEVFRLLRRPMQLGEYQLPPGVAVAPATILVHYSPDLYPEPHLFRPERFLERTYAPYEFMPFGGGNRRCIGAAFASFEMAIVLGAWLQHYDFELTEKHEVVPKRRNITIGPSSPIKVRISKR